MHYANKKFWKFYDHLPRNIQALADESYQLLKKNSAHPSLHFKKISNKYWSVRVSSNYRALGIEVKDGILWFWIGTHAEYDRLTR